MSAEQEHDHVDGAGGEEEEYGDLGGPLLVNKLEVSVACVRARVAQQLQCSLLPRGSSLTRASCQDSPSFLSPRAQHAR